jgi:dTMP kinase
MRRESIAGKFITLEGAEGAGKSSLMSAISEWLAAKGLEVLTSREPGGTPVGEVLRDLLLDPKHPITPMTELALMFASRAQHIEEIIKPALAKGVWVICDRFTDSSYAYQGSGRGFNLESISAFEALTIDNYAPDLTLLLDIPVELGLQRAAQVGEPDRFEREATEFFQRVRAGFLARAETEQRIKVIDASADKDAVERHALLLIEQLWLSSEQARA